MPGIPKGPEWADREKHWLSQIYPNCSAQDTARIIGRTVYSVRKKAKQLKIRNVYARDGWTREENKTLSEGWHENSMRFLRGKLPGRSEVAIIHQALGPLALGPRLQGMMPINKAAEAVGCCQPLLLRIAEVEGVQVVRKYKSCSNNRRLIDEEEILKAAKRYFRRENAREYRKRVGIPDREFTRILKWAGLYGDANHKVLKRLLPEEWDGVVAQYRKEKEANGGKEPRRREAPDLGPAQDGDGAGD